MSEEDVIKEMRQLTRVILTAIEHSQKEILDRVETGFFRSGQGDHFTKQSLKRIYTQMRDILGEEHELVKQFKHWQDSHK